MRTKLQGRRSIFLWVQYFLVLIAIALFGYAVQSWRLLPTQDRVEATPFVVTLVPMTTVHPTDTPSPIIDMVTIEPFPMATDTPDGLAIAVAETVTAAGAATAVAETVTAAGVDTATPTLLPIVTLEPTLVPTVASSGLTQLREQVLAATRSSRMRNAYPQQTAQFVDALLAHLSDFQLPALGVTETTVQQALKRSDVGDRLNALIQEVWADWSSVASRQHFDLYTREPTYAEHNLSPFRQLVVRLIQGRQSTLLDYQQHGLHNFLSRSEDAAVWSTNIDGVIGAVNRESFQWP